ncbi:MAG: CHASE2 domain-containing protein, partial [bacterium]|nr:CHASE2 domain-containing protein [bacterium]
MRRTTRQTAGYILVLVLCFLLAMVTGWTDLGTQIDNDAYDFMVRVATPAPGPTHSIILAIDERTLREMGGIRKMRTIVARALEAIQQSTPAAVVVDLILADQGDPAEDAQLAASMSQTPNLILSAELVPDGWEFPLPAFQQAATAVGHVHSDPDEFDNITRQIPLEKAAGRRRLWASALEAFRLYRGAPHITESPKSIEVDGLSIPASRTHARPLIVRYRRPPEGGGTAILSVSVRDLLDNPGYAALLRDKVVFVGVTAQSAADDRHMTPYSAGQPMPGVEIHATAFETLVSGNFLTPASNTATLVLCLLLAAAAGLTFAYRSGWQAYLIGAGILLAVHAAPFLFFRLGTILPFAAPVATVWLSTVGAATYQHFVVRRQLRTSETARGRYQQAIHFVTHEMRTPLTAIQGSSELMGRYQLPEEKSKELARMINAESKRLASMIQTFLDVERISEGELDVKREPLRMDRIIEACVDRVKPLADRKRMVLRLEDIDSGELVGDRELMEYAVYNLLNN